MPIPVVSPRIFLRAAVALVLAAVSLAACQPVDGPAAQRDLVDEEVTEEPQRGAPQVSTRMPADLGALLSDFDSMATQWQEEPVPAEIATTRTDGIWTSASVLYLAPDADRFLLVTADEDGTRQQRPTLETLGLEAVTPEGLAQVPRLPAGILPPDALVAAAAGALDACSVRGNAATVVYSTGAPAAWDGTRWTETPVWTAIVTEGADASGEGATVDPVSGALVDGCLDAD